MPCVKQVLTALVHTNEPFILLTHTHSQIPRMLGISVVLTVVLNEVSVILQLKPAITLLLILLLQKAHLNIKKKLMILQKGKNTTM